jgi:hypothetical protein
MKQTSLISVTKIFSHNSTLEYQFVIVSYF